MGLFGNVEKDKIYKRVLHIAGLDAKKDERCIVSFNLEEMVVSFEEKEKRIKYSQIKDLEYRVNVEENVEIKDNTVGTIVGIATMGLKGALVGAIPKIKVKKEATGYIIISYLENNIEKKVALRDSDDWTHHTAGISIELEKRAFPQKYAEKQKKGLGDRIADFLIGVMLLFFVMFLLGMWIYF